MKTKNKKKGFTLVEVLIAVSIASAAIAMTMSVFMDSFKMTFVSNAKNNINSDIRKITREMSSVARQANYFCLYESMASGKFASKAQELGMSNSGDFMLLAFRGPPTDPSNLNSRPYVRLVGYWRLIKNADENTGPVMKFDYEVPVASRSNQLYEVMPSVSTIESISTEVITLSEGLANKKLFYNHNNRAIMVNGKIIHGNEAKRVTDTYNFTITARG